MPSSHGHLFNAELFNVPTQVQIVSCQLLSPQPYKHGVLKW